jgi:hypothetical protein
MCGLILGLPYGTRQMIAVITNGSMYIAFIKAINLPSFFALKKHLA